MKIADRTTFAEKASVFAGLREQVYPHRYRVSLDFETLRGGIPSDPKVAEGWLRTKFTDSDDLIREAVAKVMVERGISAEEANEVVAADRHLNGFLRTEGGQLYLPGRYMKAGLKEAANVLWPKHQWGPSNKGTMSYIAERIFVPATHLLLTRHDGAPITEPDAIAQDFVHSRFGSSIKYTEQLNDSAGGVRTSFELQSMIDLDDSAAKVGGQRARDVSWAGLWVCGEMQGLGADRSQGYGTYAVTSFEKI